MRYPPVNAIVVVRGSRELMLMANGHGESNGGDGDNGIHGMLAMKMVMREAFTC